MTKEINIESKEIVLSNEEVQAVEFSMKDIGTASDMTEAVKVLSILNTKLDTLTADKETLTKPINEVLKTIRAKHKPFETKLEDAIAIIRTKMTKYQTEQRRIAEAKEDKIVSRIGEGKGKIKAETAIAQLENVAKPEDKVSTDEGMVKFKTVEKFEITNLAAVPVDFILPNETAIRNAMKLGKKLPGVRYYTEEVPMNFR